jgi:N-acyl homoserine lactone hydrolase
VKGKSEVFNGIITIPTPGHRPGHISVSVNTKKGSYGIIGDRMFLRDNLKPDKKHGWPCTLPGRFANSIDLWHSMEKMIENADFILMTHDPLHLEQLIYPIPE